MQSQKNWIVFSLLMSFFSVAFAQQALDDITNRSIMQERRVLPYQPIREADIFWEKRIWRVIDTREKMNLPFMYPEAPFFEIITEAASKGDIQLYTTEDDKFTYQLDNVDDILYSSDTTAIYDDETGQVIYVPVENTLNYEDIKRFRIKEVWFFNEQTSRMQVRILGIAPLQEVFDENGNFRYEKPMFWVHFPSLRQVLARHQVFNTDNDASPISWADLFEMRYFASYIYKESNVRDNRLDMMYSGVDMLLEGEKIKQEIFNFEHDLWSY